MRLISELFDPEKTEILYEFVQPLLYKVLDDNIVKLVYVIKDQTVITSDNKKALIEEILITESTEEIVGNLLQRNISIREALISGKQTLVGMIGTKVYTPIEVTSLSEIENRIPVNSIYINRR